MPPSPLPGLDACAAFADRVVGTLWWHSRFPDHTLDKMPFFRPGNGARQAFFREEEGGGFSITLPRRYRTKGVVLHELAHWALSDQQHLAHHGRAFTRLLLDATTEFCGPARAEKLTASYEEFGVQVGHPPQLTVDGHLEYGWDERPLPVDDR